MVQGEDIKRTGGLVDVMLADHGIYHLEADLRWIDATSARLDPELYALALAHAGRIEEAREVAGPPAPIRQDYAFDLHWTVRDLLASPSTIRSAPPAPTGNSCPTHTCSRPPAARCSPSRR